MNIKSTNYTHNISFKGAILNINALSDTHGNLALANNAFEEMKNRKEDIFCKEGKGKANVLAITGDWFMDGARQGYISNPKQFLGEFQLSMLNLFIKLINQLAPHKGNFFVIGNHELDGGVPLFSNLLSRMNAQVIATNLNFDNSPAIQYSIDSNKILNEKIVEIDDDKDPNKIHKVLFLGISPVNMSKYQKNLEGMEFVDNIFKPQANIKREDYEKTISFCKERISAFKKENPDGLVVLMSHTGVDFADNLAKESDVDLIFDGHEHKDEIRSVEGKAVKIIPLSQNFNKIVNTKLIIDDNGKLQDTKVQNIYPVANKQKGLMHYLYFKLFKDDFKNIYSIKTDKPSLQMLSINNIREGNNYLANFVVDSVLSELKKKDSSIDFFALNASAIRHPLRVSDKAGISNLDIMNVLAGITDNDAKLMKTEVSGKELAYLIADNYSFNRIAPKKNPIIHYAGLITDRTKILEVLDEGRQINNLTKLIVDKRTKQPIEPDKTYVIANPVKYFNKSENQYIRDLKDRSQSMDVNIQFLFRKHFKESNGTLKAECDKRIK